MFWLPDMKNHMKAESHKWKNQSAIVIFSIVFTHYEIQLLPTQPTPNSFAKSIPKIY